MALGARGSTLSWLGLVVVSVAVGVTLWGQATPALAAGRPTDLSAVLGPPPASGLWVPIPSGVVDGYHYGPLDENTVVGEGPDRAGTLSELIGQQFTRGYRKGWRQRASNDVLLEEAEEFRHDGGAADHLARDKFADQTDSTFQGLFDTPGLDHAYGAQFVDNDGFQTVSVVFTKGNLIIYVIGGSYNLVNTDMVLNQARYVHLLAPAESTVPEDTLAGLPRSSLNSIPHISTSSAIEILGGSVLLGLVLVLVVGLAIRRQQRAARSEGMPTLSGDRRYWWDGRAWQDGTITAPPTAPRSTDGDHWFDGVQWRPVPPAPVLPAGQDGTEGASRW